MKKTMKLAEFKSLVKQIIKEELKKSNKTIKEGINNEFSFKDVAKYLVQKFPNLANCDRGSISFGDEFGDTEMGSFLYSKKMGDDEDVFEAIQKMEEDDQLKDRAELEVNSEEDYQEAVSFVKKYYNLLLNNKAIIKVIENENSRHNLPMLKLTTFKIPFTLK